MRTLVNLFEESVKKNPDNTLLLEKTSQQYYPLTYKEIQAEVHRFGAGLISLGINKGDTISLLAEGCKNWLISELGIFYAGAINVPLSIKLTDSDEIKFRLEHSQSKILIVSKSQYQKLSKLKDEVSNIEKIIVFGNGELEKGHEKDILFNDVLQMGDKLLKNNSSQFEERWNNINEDDYATISYTSGTTADPKGIILSHRNYTANVEQSLSLFDVPHYFITLLILPWDHAFAHTVGIYPLLKNGGCIASVQVGETPLETLKNIPVNIKESKPYFILSVPALAKNFKNNIEKEIKSKGSFTWGLFKHALNISYKYNGNGHNKGKGLKALLKPLVTLYNKILFSKIKDNFGGNLQFFVGGGALLDIELQRFFYGIGIPMYQGYGLSEAAPVISSNNVNQHKMGSSGITVENIEVKICDDKGNLMPNYEKGEIVVKGENVMVGYWRNEVATKETIKDGWLHTGDLGYFDDDGFLYVMGRFKSLLISDDGEKFSPEGIEEALVENSEYIDQCMLYNNQNPYTVGLIVINKEAIKRWLKNKVIDKKTREEAIIEVVSNSINQFRNGGKFEKMFPQRWLPTTICILEEGFTEENRLMNSTMKIVRPKITECYQEQLDFMYTLEGKKMFNEKNISSIRQLLN